jgi:hypothetical protein
MTIIVLSRETYARACLTENFGRITSSDMWRRSKTYDPGGIYKATENLEGGTREGDLLQCLGKKDEDGQVFKFLKVEKTDKGGYVAAASNRLSADSGLREIRSGDFQALHKVDHLAVVVSVGRLASQIPALPGRAHPGADALAAHFPSKDFRRDSTLFNPVSILVRPTGPEEYTEIPGTLKHQERGQPPVASSGRNAALVVG